MSFLRRRSVALTSSEPPHSSKDSRGVFAAAVVIVAICIVVLALRGARARAPAAVEGARFDRAREPAAWKGVRFDPRVTVIEIPRMRREDFPDYFA